MKIIDTAQAMPPSGHFVLAWLEGSKIPMRALWADKFSLGVSSEQDPEWGEYCEEKDEYFRPAGWYEMNQHEESHWRVDGNVVAWCELPRLDAGAAPAAVGGPALDVTLDEDQAGLLRDMLGDPAEYEEAITVRLIVCDGHSGHGLYVAQAEYQDEGTALLAPLPATAAPALEAPAAPSRTYVAVLQCDCCGHIGINDAADGKAACNSCDWQGDSPAEDKCPGCNTVGTMTSGCPECGARTSLIAETHLPAAAPQAPAAPSGTDEVECVCGASWERHGHCDYEMVHAPRKAAPAAPLCEDCGNTGTVYDGKRVSFCQTGCAASVAERRADAAAPAAPVAQFRKRPVTISAIQWTGKNLREVITFTDGPPETRGTHAGMAWEAYTDLVERDGLMIYTLEGKMHASVGDWIIRGVKGEHYACKPDIFAETYEPAMAAPAAPSDAQLLSEWDRVSGITKATERRLACMRAVLQRWGSAAPAAPAVDAEGDGWYLQDTRSYVGNDVLWWAKDGKGYTTDVSKAHVFTREEAFSQAAMRGVDRAWPKAYIDGKTRPAVDMQYINHDQAIAAQAATKGATVHG